ncbi:MAG: sel1 repeat family protein [Bacilli bacterium]|nr:sel1 repeat family protein [Bacilli bacterium]
MEINLTQADMNAVSNRDSDFLNSKGAKFYGKEEYEKAVEYYRLASSMGNIQATSNLGYCYLYGRSIPVNVDLAIQYFKIAAERGNMDAIYKLGDIYSRDKWGKEDKEMASYYYLKGLKEFDESLWELYYNDDVRFYPSLFFAIGRESMPNGILNTDLDLAYISLKIAQEGYEKYLADGDKMYQESYENVLKLLEDEELSDAKSRFEDRYGINDEFDEDEEE